MDDWVIPVFSAQGRRPAYPAGTYEEVFKALRDAPGTMFLAARSDGRTVAVNMAFAAGDRAYGWQAAVDPAYKPAYPQALLMWHGLLWARSAGASHFDLVGAPNEGIAAYKRRLGGLEEKFSVLRRQSVAHRLAAAALSRAPKGPAPAAALGGSSRRRDPFPASDRVSSPAARHRPVRPD
jgi:CelD/BcsL family acetyltransferase involved in cellulose biosynthesis